MVYQVRENSGSSTVPADLNFSIPPCGREAEISHLKEAYQRVVCPKEGDSCMEMVIIKGESGTGKSTLLDTLRNDNRDALFCCGKFDSIGAAPYAALVDALSELCESLSVHQDYAIIQERLHDSLGQEDPAILSSVIGHKSFNVLFGNSDYSRDVTFRKEFGFERLKKALHLFMTLVCSESRQTVLFIDDLQWIDEGSVAIIESLLTDGSIIKGLLLVLAYRDNEIHEKHPLHLMLNRIQQSDSHVHVTVIQPRNLDPETLNELVSAVLQQDTSVTKPLADVVYQKTHGNPFHTLQFLKMLQEERLLFVSPATMKCEWKLERIRSETQMANTVVELIAKKVDRLPRSTRDVLKVAACLGTRFDLSLIVAILGVEAQEGDVEDLARESLVVALNEGLIDKTILPDTYRFVHDRIHHSVYILNSDDMDRDALHLRIGRHLKERWECTSSDDTREAWTLLAATEQLNLGSSLINTDEEKVALAEMNLETARYVMTKSAFFPASENLATGLALIPELSKWDDHYEKTLEICSMLAETSYCCGDFVTCRIMVNQVLEHAVSPTERLRVQFILVKAQASDGDIEKAIDIGIGVLNHLGLRCQKDPIALRLVLEHVSAMRLLSRYSEDEILSLPKATDEIVQATGEMAGMVSVYAFQTGRMKLMTLLTYVALKLCLRRGLTNRASEVFGGVGVLQAVRGDYELANKMGGIAMKLMSHENVYIASPMTLCIKIGFLDFRRPIQDSIDSLMLLYNMSMENGDIHFAAIASVIYSTHYLYSGLPLAPLNENIGMFVVQLTKYRQYSQGSIIRIYRQCVHNFMGKSKDPLVLTGDAMDQVKMLQHLHETHNHVAIMTLLSSRMMLCYIFGRLDVAGEMLDAIWSNPRQLMLRSTHVILCYMFGGLTAIALATTRRRRKYKKRAGEIIQLFETLVRAGAVNCHHILLFLYSELAKLENKDTDFVKASYDKAIASASRSGFSHHSALINEQAGIFFLENNDEDWGEFYLAQCYQLYDEWGATAKTAQLSEKYSFLAAERRQLLAINKSRFLKGQARFSRENEAKHKGKLLEKLVIDDSEDFLDNSLTQRRIIDLHS